MPSFLWAGSAACTWQDVWVQRLYSDVHYCRIFQWMVLVQGVQDYIQRPGRVRHADKALLNLLLPSLRAATCRAATWCASGAASARRPPPLGACRWKTQTCRQHQRPANSMWRRRRRRFPRAAQPATGGAITRPISGACSHLCWLPTGCLGQNVWKKTVFRLLPVSDCTSKQTYPLGASCS